MRLHQKLTPITLFFVEEMNIEKIREYYRNYYKKKVAFKRKEARHGNKKCLNCDILLKYAGAHNTLNVYCRDCVKRGFIKTRYKHGWKKAN